MGVRERVVKPATEFAGLIAMSSIATLLTLRLRARARCLTRRFFRATRLTACLLVLWATSADAASATAQFQVGVRVIKSCHVSTDSLASQAASANATVKGNCGTGTAPAGSLRSGSGVGSGLPIGSADVNYSVTEVAGTDGGFKLLTINF